VVIPGASAQTLPSSAPPTGAAVHCRWMLGGGYGLADAGPAASPASAAVMPTAAASLSAALAVCLIVIFLRLVADRDVSVVGWPGLAAGCGPGAALHRAAVHPESPGAVRPATDGRASRTVHRGERPISSEHNSLADPRGGRGLAFAGEATIRSDENIFYSERGRGFADHRTAGTVPTAAPGAVGTIERPDDQRLPGAEHGGPGPRALPGPWPALSPGVRRAGADDRQPSAPPGTDQVPGGGLGAGVRRG
jgi:hypothetical protein